MVTNRDRKSFGSSRNNSKRYSDEWHRWRFLIRVQVFRDPLRGELPHVQIFMNDGSNPLTWDAQLLSYWVTEIRRSFKINSWIWSVTSGVVTVLDPGRDASHVEKSPRLNWATQFLTVAYDGACSPNVSVSALPCGGNKTQWQLASPCC